MYLHLGQNEIIPQRRIIGIFDLDKHGNGELLYGTYLLERKKPGWKHPFVGPDRQDFLLGGRVFHVEQGKIL